MCSCGPLTLGTCQTHCVTLLSPFTYCLYINFPTGRTEGTRAAPDGKTGWPTVSPRRFWARHTRPVTRRRVRAAPRVLGSAVALCRACGCVQLGPSGPVVSSVRVGSGCRVRGVGRVRRPGPRTDHRAARVSPMVRRVCTF